ncbi:MAG: O-antigen ligase family protein, partial [Planctomycetota bacterium]|nr:O-antigen ligase family protein [Planctomycetota bacterium]
KEVFFESTRSLQFRLYYWTGTLRMLREQPVTGAGPGNFRQVYLQYKSNETSEEIRDPHNFLLDAWSSSGLIGLSGVMLIIGCSVLRLRQRPIALEEHKSGPVQKSITAPRDRPMRIVATGILSGFLVHLAWAWLNGAEEWTFQSLLLTGGLVLLAARGRASFRPVDSTACLAASTAMMVNLLAAGGFEMPAVMVTLLFCLAAGISVNAKPAPAKSHFRSVLRTAACLAAVILVIQFGLLPVTAAGNHIQIGDSLLNNSQYPARALDQFQQAALADSQSPTPRQRIAEVLSYRLSEVVALRAAEMGVAERPTAAENSHGKIRDENRKLVDQALQACEDLILADRRNSFSYRLRAEVRWNSSLLNEDHEFQILAIQDLETATRLYPSSVDGWYRLAERLDFAGLEHVKAAGTAADRVLELETLNRAWGHADRFLTDEQLAIVKQIAGE